jgi:hypothetical protein
LFRPFHWLPPFRTELVTSFISVPALPTFVSVAHCAGTCMACAQADRLCSRHSSPPCTMC